MVKIAGTVNDTMDFNSSSAEDIEDEIRSNNQNTIAILTKFAVSRYSSEERIMLKPSNAFIESVDERYRSVRAIFCNEFENGKQIFLSNWKISECSLTWHSVVDEVWPSFDGV